tara:strand:+ start:9744 stop:10709 length:966 start_codon:yes stop_codon:yes gene_type:complete
MVDKLDLKQLFETQRKFSSLFHDFDKISSKEKESLTQEYALALHAEVSSLVSEINFKSHEQNRKQVVENSILFEGVDVFRYLLAILNLWGFSAEDFAQAFDDKENYLQVKYVKNAQKWEGQPVILVDADDVIVEFRQGYSDYLNSFEGISVDPESSEYYFTNGIPKDQYNPEQLFQDFIDQRFLRGLKATTSTIEVLNDLYDQGYWIQILTARPSWNKTCRYDTYSWLENSGLKFHKIDFSPEKMIWAANSQYYDQGSIVCAIDDSSKHAMEYAKHGIKVAAPIQSYNGELSGVDNVVMYQNGEELRDAVKQFSNSRIFSI